MSRFCMSCGGELPENAAVCPRCGAPVKPIPAPTPAPIPAPTPAPVAAPTPVPVAAPVVLNGGEDTKKPLSFWTYLGLIVLFCVPVAGLVAAIIFSFTAKNENLKNFARAATAWLAVVAVLTCLAFFAIKTVVDLALKGAEAALRDFLDSNGVTMSEDGEIDLNELFDVFDEELAERGIEIHGEINFDEE